MMSIARIVLYMHVLLIRVVSQLSIPEQKCLRTHLLCEVCDGFSSTASCYSRYDLFGWCGSPWLLGTPFIDATIPSRYPQAQTTRNGPQPGAHEEFPFRATTQKMLSVLWMSLVFWINRSFRWSDFVVLTTYQISRALHSKMKHQ